MDALAMQVLAGLLRTGLAGLSGYLVKKGIDDGGLTQVAVGAVPGAVAAGWSWFNKVFMHRTVATAAATGSVPSKFPTTFGQ